MKTKQNGYVTLIAILVVVVLVVIWMLYLWEGKPGGNSMRIDQGIENPNDIDENSAESVPVDAQLDNLRDDINYVQDERNRQIYEALEESK